MNNHNIGNQKNRTKIWNYFHFLAILFCVVLLIYIGPLLLFTGAAKLDEISSKINSSKNIMNLIDDSSMKGAQFDRENNNLTVSWELMSTPMTQVKYASSKDLGRLAKHVYNGPPYDTYQVDKKKLKVNFISKRKKVFTVFFTGI